MKFLASTTKFFPIIFVLAVSTIYHFWELPQGFHFNYDQQIAAEAAYNFLKLGKISLIGQELSFQGFFLGPVHNWVEFIPYSICNLKPDCVPYFFASIGVISVLILYLNLKKMLGNKTAIIVSSIYAFSFKTLGWERGVNSNYFLFLSSLAILFCLHQYYYGKSKYLILGGFISGIATVNFNPVFIFSSIAFFLASLIPKNRQLKIYSLSLVAFFINLLPLFIFNLRHNNLLLSALEKFGQQNIGQADYSSKAINLTRILISFISDYLFQSASFTFVIFTVMLLLLGSYKVFKNRNKSYYFLPLSFIVAFTGFIPYGGHIPDYYFIQIILPAIILISLALRTNLILFLIFIIAFIFNNFSNLYKYESSLNYQTKKETIKYILLDTKGDSFNVYFQMPPGANTGYSYIFKAYGLIPQEGGNHIYFVEQVDPWSFNLAKYRRSFPNQKITVQTFGYNHVVSIN